MAEAVYVLCAITSLMCAVLLYKGYRDSRTPLLFWSSLCFTGLALNNVLLLLDLTIFLHVANVDLRLWRTGIAVASLYMLLHGLVGESR
jgi:hypothetical protein